ncbi:glutamine--fructose-6-phosphate aminotransferase [isomerizing] [Clostridia bacterium]|nr:glutamine--fructose-6-phosphate aminotransferase [isomerizing] [Clostridia bacterium]
MCGIIGYTGSQDSVPILLRGLTALEYRGYDSAGLAVLNEYGQIDLVKKKGRIAELQKALTDICVSGHTGIAHTRWATHGQPSDVNSHPHMDISNRFAIVHNGIIENYLMLKQALMNEGVLFRSQTDTEVIVHLIAKFYMGDLKAAVRAALKQLKGSFALLVLCADNPSSIVCAAKDNPLIIGEGEGENFIASDIPALLEHTKKIYRLADAETAEVTPDGIEIFGADGQRIQKAAQLVDWDVNAAKLEGNESFMLKEIREIPAALANTLARYTGKSNPLLTIDKKAFQNIDKIVIVACGTAYHAGLVGKYAIEKLVRLPVQVEIASEFRYGNPIVDARTLCVAISQSGETADTIAAVKEAKARGCVTLAVANVVGSSITYAADYSIPTLAGPEIAVASTKAYNSQLMALYCLCAHIAKVRGTLDKTALRAFYAGLKRLPALAKKLTEGDGGLIKLAASLKNEHSIFFLGRGLDYYVAMESSLKLKEISYIHCEAYAAGELKHGTLALVEEGTAVIVLLTERAIAEKTLNAVSEVKARRARVIAVAPKALDLTGAPIDKIVRIPDCPDLFAPVLSIIPCQKLAYYTARARGFDADKPRNLAKSVTVE